MTLPTDGRSERPRTIETDGARLFVRAIGAGRPIVVLHGGPDFDHAYLLPELDRLADLGRLVVYDQRGRGRSFTGERADDVSFDGEMDDLDAVRRWAGSDSVTLLAHSFGTVLALEYATRHPDRVSHLVLLNPAPASHSDLLALRDHLIGLRTAAQRDRMAELIADPRYVRGDPALDAEYHAIHFAAAFHDPTNLERLVRRLRRHFTPASIVAARTIQRRLQEQTWLVESYDLLPRLHSLRVPTVVIHGDHDFIPLPIASHIADAIPAARLVELARCGHFALMEQPDAVHREVATHLSR